MQDVALVLEGGGLRAIYTASSSLPFMANPHSINRQTYLDGGIAAPIPVAKAQQDGYKRQVVILTQDASYRKSPMKFNWLARKRYQAYPAVAAALKVRHQSYNQSLEELAQSVASGNTFVIRPAASLNLSRLDRNIDKVTAVYHQGLADGQAILPKLQAWLDKGIHAGE